MFYKSLGPFAQSCCNTIISGVCSVLLRYQDANTSWHPTGQIALSWKALIRHLSMLGSTLRDYGGLPCLYPFDARLKLDVSVLHDLCQSNYYLCIYMSVRGCSSVLWCTHWVASLKPSVVGSIWICLCYWWCDVSVSIAALLELFALL